MPLDAVIAERLHRLRGYTPADLLPHPSDEMLASFRAFGAPVGEYEPPPATVHDQIVPGPHGEVRLRIYTPVSGHHSGAGLVWLHGGGFAAGDLDMAEADVTAREACACLDATVVSVDYRLARDGVCFPVPHDDVLAAWSWTVDATAELGIDRRWLALGGGSAGGNLAAGAALALRDRRAPLPSALLLAYPVMHFELPPSGDSPMEIESLPVLLRFPPDLIATMNGGYLGDRAPTPYAFPALGDPAGLPPTAVVLAEYDDLRISGELFADALRVAGVRVTVRCEPGVVHGHLNIPGLAGWKRSLRFLTESLAATSPSSGRETGSIAS